MTQSWVPGTMCVYRLRSFTGPRAPYRHHSLWAVYVSSLERRDSLCQQLVSIITRPGRVRLIQLLPSHMDQIQTETNRQSGEQRGDAKSCSDPLPLQQPTFLAFTLAGMDGRWWRLTSAEAGGPRTHKANNTWVPVDAKHARSPPVQTDGWALTHTPHMGQGCWETARNWLHRLQFGREEPTAPAAPRIGIHWCRTQQNWIFVGDTRGGGGWVRYTPTLSC